MSKSGFDFDRDIIAIVGGGAAGLMAAAIAASSGKKVVVFERNQTNGKKLLITGKGRCNLTNACDDVEELIENTPGNGKFLYSSFYTHSNQEIMDFFAGHGLNLKVERGQRVFPASDRAADVLNTLEKVIRTNGGKVINNARVTRLAFEGEGTTAKRVTGIYAQIQVGNQIGSTEVYIPAKSVILATGGLSCPKTGSTGDGYRLAESVGHTIVSPKPSLVPLISTTRWVKELQGLSLRNVLITFRDKSSKKVLYEEQGEMLFTHFGVSGPVVLSASRHLLSKNYKGIEMVIDLKPALNHKKLDERIIRDFQMLSRRQFVNSLGDLLPKKLIPIIVELSQIPPDKQVDQITVGERKQLLDVMKTLTLSIDGSRSINEAIVTAGGVNTKEINSSTMESKCIQRLFFAGEMIDVDAYTGGFNLTIAFSTAWLAADNV